LTSLSPAGVDGGGRVVTGGAASVSHGAGAACCCFVINRRSSSSDAAGAAAATQPSARPRAVAPRKQPRPKSELDHRAETWPALPSVSTSDLYEVVKAMPDTTPVQLADVIIRRYDLDKKKRCILASRLSAVMHTRDTMS